LGFGVKGIDAVVFGGDKDNAVMASAVDGEAGKIERLSVDFAVHGVGELQSKCC